MHEVLESASQSVHTLFSRMITELTRRTAAAVLPKAQPMIGEPLEARRMFALTYSVDQASFNGDTNRYNAAVSAIQIVVNRYNAYGDFTTGDDGNIEVNYNAGVPTAEASPNGGIAFGGTYPGERVMLHESNHWMGTVYGHNPNEPGPVALYEQFDGIGSRFGTDGTHFWGYGMNYDNEFSEIAAQRNIAIVYAFRRAWGYGTQTDPTAWAATHVTLTGSDAAGESGFNYGSKWSDNTFAHYNADYSTGAYDMRTPNGYPSWTFAGKSLTVNNGGRLLFNGYGTDGVVTFNNLTVDGGTIRHDQYSQDLFQLAGNIAVPSSVTFDAAQGDIKLLSSITGAGSITKTGANTLTLNGTDGATGGISVNQGTLALGADDRIADASRVTLNGGTFATGGYNETAGLLDLSASSTLDMGNGYSKVKFSGPGVFSSGKTLAITNWTPANDRIFIGTSASLTSAQLSQITINGSAVSQLSTGELVKAVSGAPTFVNAAAASPATVTATTTTLSALGSDDGGEANLVYAWTATGPAPVSYSANSSNGAKSTIATFTKAGTYVFTVTAADPGGMASTSTRTVVVNATPTTITLNPAPATVGVGTTQQFSAASVTDQFDATISSPSLTWSVVSGGGSISGSGLYTAPTTAGAVTVQAAGGTTSVTTTIKAVAIDEAFGFYKAEEINGTYLSDYSGHNKHGTLVGSYALDNGYSGKGIKLTGGYAALPTGITNASGSVTVAAWIKPTQLDTWSRVFDFGNDTNSYMFLTPQAGGTNLPRFAITNSGGGGEQVVNSNTALTVGKWNHVAVTFSGTTATLYLNGVAVGSNNAMTVSPASLGNTTNNYVGKSQYPDAPFIGTVDDVRVYGRALSASEVSAIASQGSAAPTVATAAAASPTTVTGKTTGLSVTGADDNGQADLTYTWSATGPAAVTFSANGTNAAKSSVATFTRPGSYVFTATIADTGGRTVTSTVNVTVATTLTAITAVGKMAAGTATQLSVLDQFGNAVSPSTTWSTTGGSIAASGVLTAPSTSGTATVTATIGSTQLTTNVAFVPSTVYYAADQSTGTTLTDSSGNSRTGSLVGSTAFVAGKAGNALDLNGGYAILPGSAINGLTDFTVAAWIKPDALTNWTRVFDFGTGTSSNMFLTPCAGDSGALRFGIKLNDGAEQRIDGPALTAGQWTHVAVTLVGTVGTLYVNGVAVASNSNITLNPSSLGTMTQTFIGKSQYADPNFAGLIDDFRVYGAGLSAAGIGSLAKLGTPAATSAMTAAKSGTKANLSWKDNSTNETGFHVWSSRDGSIWSLLSSVGSATNSGTTVSNTTATLASGLWYFKTSAYNANGDSFFSNTVSVTI